MPINLHEESDMGSQVNDFISFLDRDEKKFLVEASELQFSKSIKRVYSRPIDPEDLQGPLITYEASNYQPTEGSPTHRLSIGNQLMTDGRLDTEAVEQPPSQPSINQIYPSINESNVEFDDQT